MNSAENTTFHEVFITLKSVSCCVASGAWSLQATQAALQEIS